MSIRRTLVLAGSALLVFGVVAAGRLAAQQSNPSTMNGKMTMNDMKGTAMTKPQKIANAMAAAPAEISAKATILDWPTKEGAAPEMLRPGTNGWTCFPDMPDVQGNDPGCMDDTWMKWADAYMAHKTPEVSRVGIAYMLAPGGPWGSNTDPFAMKETATNEWGHDGPHLMILVPDLKSLAGLPTHRTAGSPYVMWPGTPYAHIMAPVTSGSMAMGK